MFIVFLTLRKVKNDSFFCVKFLSINLIFTLLLAKTAFPQDSVITFSFNPPDGTTFIEHVRTSKSILIEGDAQSDERIMEDRYKYTIRKTNYGYAVENIFIESSGTIPEDLRSIERSLISNFVITYELNHEGQFIKISGLDEAILKLEKKVPMAKEMLAIIVKMMGGKSLEQMYIDHWNNRQVLGLLVGRTLKMNKDHRVKGDYPLPSGESMSALFNTKLGGFEDYNGHTCVSIETTIESDDAVIGETLTNKMANVIKVTMSEMLSPDEESKLSQSIPQMKYSNMKIVNKFKRLVDPETGLPYSEINTQHIYMTLEIEGEDKKKGEIYEQNVYSYEY